MLDGLARDIARVCVDFTQYPESYYFHDGPGDTSLARTIGFAADWPSRRGGRNTRMSASRLRCSPQHSTTSPPYSTTASCTRGTPRPNRS
ncbi:hypothetical protein SUDANB51_04113 [Streptomyces sp. enrichment culture]